MKKIGRNQFVREILFGISLFVLLGLCAPIRGNENNFVNFKVADVSKNNLKQFVVGTKAAELAQNYSGAQVTKTIPQIGKTVLTFDNPEQAQQFVEAAQAQNLAPSVEKDPEVHAMASFNDPKYSAQTNLSQMEMSTGWDYLNDISSTSIAIVDTGVRGTHEDLTGKVSAGYNVLTSSAIAANADSDDNGHGTGMASIAAASANNSVGIVGVAYSASVIPVKVLNSAGNGLASDVATGVIWAADDGAKVINLSLGSSDYSQTLHDAIQYAANKNCIIVAAAGNEGTGTLDYPGSDSLVVSVGSVNSSNARSSFSNYGSTLDVMAPGESIWHANFSADNTYSEDSGTSVSTAEVSGVAALAAAWHSGATASEVDGYLSGSALKLSGMNGSDRTDYYGYGLVDYSRVQTAAGDFHYSYVSQSIYPTLDTGQSSNFILTIKNTGGSTWRQQSVNLGTYRPQDRIPEFTRAGDGPSGWLTQNRVELQQPTVAPGQTGTFSFWMRNDTVTPGYYQEYFRPVVENVGWMDDDGIFWGVTVPSASDRYHYQWVSQNVYPTMDSGQAYNFQLTIKNTGTLTWIRGSVNLGTSKPIDRIPELTREGDGPSGWLSANRIYFQEASVAPGQTATYSFWMRNDGVSPGTYSEYFRPVADGVGWMEDDGIFWNVKVPTEAERYSYAWVSQNVYPTLATAQSYNFQLTIKNTGSTTWQRGSVNLGTYRGQDRIPEFTREGDGPSGWLSANRIFFNEASVAPGETATYSFWMRNDGLPPGYYKEYFCPVVEGVTWMQDLGIYWGVNVP